MTYTYTCDWCGESSPDSPPALMCEFNERWFKSTPEGGYLADHNFDPGVIVTLCGSCTVDLLITND